MVWVGVRDVVICEFPFFFIVKILFDEPSPPTLKSMLRALYSPGGPLYYEMSRYENDDERDALVLSLTSGMMKIMW